MLQYDWSIILYKYFWKLTFVDGIYVNHSKHALIESCTPIRALGFFFPPITAHHFSKPFLRNVHVVTELTVLLMVWSGNTSFGDIQLNILHNPLPTNQSRIEIFNCSVVPLSPNWSILRAILSFMSQFAKNCSCYNRLKNSSKIQWHKV
jgi:hypothetical protein